ncbi:calmodulin-binding transcription activator 4-like isoform X1 [Dendrobium catenatum]|uniref:Calmodulin-binding transcription activator 4 n=1 Tax=Dendrobium catenatum TaxID=906689 RepID=A0A2I0X442_9ASPA|nr:calmodulin-binding transcription activator 4-like isoform X1 [Dendrobium catenatum]PKU82672.1 Calmodulin-binding transcription activator 4 [Dendrobium catenatum]
MQSGLSFHFGKLRQDAQNRWLKNSEVLFILQNHENLPIEQETPDKPTSGSLFLFNRRVLKFFRKDGHMWRKKKDGRAVGEAHERLKVGNVDALNCYYAHGEKNRYFQRRIYWMLDHAYDHIVLVHYREVSEGRFLPPIDSQQTQEPLSSRNGNSSANNIQFRRVPSATSEVYDSCETSCSPISGEANSQHVGKDVDTNRSNMFNTSANSDPLSQQEINLALRDLEEQLSLDKYDDNVPVDILPVHTDEHKNLEDLALMDSKTWNSFQKLQENLTPMKEYTGCDQGVNGQLKSHDRKISPSWNDMLERTELDAHGRAFNAMALANGSKPSTINAAGAYHHGIENEFKHGSQFSSENIFDAQLEQISWQHPGRAGNYAGRIADGSDINRLLFLGLGSLGSPDSVVDLAAGELYNAPGTTGDGRNSNEVSVQKENGIDYMGNVDLYDRNNAYSSDLLGMYSDQGQHGSSIAEEPCLTVPHKLLFRIREISPEWSFSFERTKVIITGDFLCNPSSRSWAVMFGEVQVPAEIIQEGVLRCQAPEHSSGKVALCITSGNKESCSEVREFEFHSKSVTSSLETSHLVNATINSEELSLLVEFINVLLCRSDELSVSKGAEPKETECRRKLKAAEDQWFQSHELQTEILPGAIDGILQELIKDKFQQWLSSKTNAKEDGSCLLSNTEQHIIHMISGLGYEWALKPILDAGVGINFRDANGRTALHWAARFGREKMAAALLATGAFAGAVTDPTPQDPVGKTAGAIAAASGHNGLAGYLSEAYLTDYLYSIKGLTVVEDEKIVESISERSASVQVGETEDALSLKDSLAAVRNAAQAAARIQAAFRAHSFKKRQEKEAMNRDEYGMTSEEMHCLASSIKIQKTLNSYPDQKLDKAALSIQTKYRGWKGRKAFLSFRQRVVKIQAHVRGHQARMKYKELLSAVSVLEKLILRWRRRGVGLRGFLLKSDIADEGEEEDIIKVFRKQKVDAALEQALSRVLSMVESPRSRQQYRRMLECYCQVKAEQQSAEEAIPRLRDYFELVEDDEFLHWLQEDQL